ncbi:MAG: hypothetical protein QME76_04325 [Bacillota bacterium]|nr:hypothetical protein [Bacillota bacterium]
MGIITAADLEQWAGTNVARDRVGELLRQLVCASIPLPSIRTFRFLANESNQLSGWDGLLECDSTVPWVPNGTSVWELGTGSNNRAKIRRDFESRRSKELPGGWSRELTTYVAVTVRKLKNVTALENELRKNSSWQAVKVYDANTLEEWIDRYPAVQVWLQEQGVGPPPTIHSLRRAWSLWSEETIPSISTRLVLTGRDKIAQDFRDAIGTQEVINVRADSPDEAVAFIYAAIDAGEPEFREHTLARSIVVRKPSDTDVLRHLPPQVVILLPPATERAQLIARSDHTVINAHGNSSPHQRIQFPLPRPLRSEFATALADLGMTKEQAEVEARACGASPSVWRIWNKLYQSDVCDLPEWATPEKAHLAVPAILLGGWSERYEGDRLIIKNFTGRDFEDYCSELQHFISTDNPLLTKVGDAWVVTAPAAAFALVVRNITQTHLSKLAEITLQVFSEIDPTIDVHPDERPFATLQTQGMKHSTWLRDGLAESLLRIVVLGERLEETGVIPGNQERQSFVDNLIRKLPGLNKDYRLIASLRNQLPVLAEVAPIPFLDALERLLQGPPESILPIFREGKGTFSGDPFYPSLLWALETLAWEPRYLARVGLVLARLAKVDPGGQLSNRPINTLREVFLAWHPGTSANLDERLQALDLILKREPEIGWNLLIQLMPSLHEISRPTREPIWRDFGRSAKGTLTRSMVWEAYRQLIDRAILHADQDPNRWKELVSLYSNVSPPHRQAMENGLRELAQTALPPKARMDLWSTLRKEVNNHLGFPNASWALPKDDIDRLSTIVKLFEPRDTIDQVSWIFDDHWPDIPFPRNDIDNLHVEIERLRNEAVVKVWQSGGIETLIDLIDRVRYPDLVVQPTVNLIGDKEQLLKIFEKTNGGSTNQRQFAQSLSSQAYKQYDKEWTGLILYQASQQGWSTEALVNAIQGYPDSLETFALVESLGSEVERRYWEVRHGWIYTDDSSAFRLVIERFLWVGRALDIIAQPPNRLSMLNSNEIIGILDQALQELNEGKSSSIAGSVSYHIDSLFEILRSRNDVDQYELAKREYAYLPLLTRYPRPKNLALYNLLANSPALFVTIICDLYKPASGEHDQNLSEDQKLRAKFAWELLHSWHKPPGIDGSAVDGQKLRDWVREARQLAAERDRAVVADQHIGRVLFYLPTDSTDAAWPHVELRQLLEDLQSAEIELGIEIEQYNSRGTVNKQFFEGGKQERELAKKWRSWAETMGSAWPRTRALLERIANSWEAEAVREDQRAEKDRLRYG